MKKQIIETIKNDVEEIKNQITNYQNKVKEYNKNFDNILTNKISEYFPKFSENGFCVKYYSGALKFYHKDIDRFDNSFLRVDIYNEYSSKIAKIEELKYEISVDSVKTFDLAVLNKHIEASSFIYSNIYEAAEGVYKFQNEMHESFLNKKIDLEEMQYNIYLLNKKIDVLISDAINNFKLNVNTDLDGIYSHKEISFTVVKPYISKIARKNIYISYDTQIGIQTEIISKENFNNLVFSVVKHSL